jgi:retinoid hydroxylase
MTNLVKSISTIPSTESFFPFVGDALRLFLSKEQFVIDSFERLGSIFLFEVMGMNLVCLVGPDANQFILKDHTEYFSSDMGWSFLDPLLGKTISRFDGDSHRRIRRLMMPSFHSASIHKYTKIIHEIAHDVTAKQFAVDNNICLIKFFGEVNSQIAWTLLLGERAKGQIEYLASLFQQLSDGVQTILRFDGPFTAFGRARIARDKLRSFLLKEVHYRRKYPHDDVLGMLVSSTDQDGNSLTDEEIVLNALQLVFGGFDTVPNLLSWSLYELSVNPDYLQSIRKDQSFLEYNNLDVLRKSLKLDHFLKEIERLYPAAYLIPRGVVKSFEYEGYKIPSGHYVAYSPLLTHRLPDIYKKPNQFDPDRFAFPREEHKVHPFALIGFGGGAHKCLGFDWAQLEMRIILATLVQNYDWKVFPHLDISIPRRQSSVVSRSLVAQFQAVQR